MQQPPLGVGIPDGALPIVEIVVGRCVLEAAADSILCPQEPYTEFDSGVNELKRVIGGGCAATIPGDAMTSCARGRYGGARFRYIAANVVDGRGRLVVEPYVIRRFEGIPVGFIGGVTKTTPQMVMPSGIRGLTFQDEADAANRAARELDRVFRTLFEKVGLVEPPAPSGEFAAAAGQELDALFGE